MNRRVKTSPSTRAAVAESTDRSRDRDEERMKDIRRLQKADPAKMSSSDLKNLSRYTTQVGLGAEKSAKVRKSAFPRKKYNEEAN